MRFTLLVAVGCHGATATADEDADRIVSVGGALTEIIYALDAQSHLVGVDTTSLWPESAQTLPQVGYMRALSAEGILSLTPDRLIASAHAGPPPVLEQIRSAGVEVSIFPEDYSEAGVINKITAVAELLSKQAAGTKLAHTIRADFQQLADWRAKLTRHPKVLFFMAVSHGAPLVSGRDTPADAMIRLAGGSNAASDFSGNKAIGSETIIAAAPEVILLTDISVNALGGLDKCYQLPGIAQTPAGENRRLIVVDTLALLGFGLRSGQAALALAKQLHQQPNAAAHAE
ncbi:MAG: hemin ABC transporter substrate-binding protein [Methylomonas sp.]|nr:MAG: hemin ABC transporter substrate-binding protein [Methylomonas sp.]